MSKRKKKRRMHDQMTSLILKAYGEMEGSKTSANGTQLVLIWSVVEQKLIDHRENRQTVGRRKTQGNEFDERDTELCKSQQRRFEDNIGMSFVVRREREEIRIQSRVRKFYFDGESGNS